MFGITLSYHGEGGYGSWLDGSVVELERMDRVRPGGECEWFGFHFFSFQFLAISCSFSICDGVIW